MTEQEIRANERAKIFSWIRNQSLGLYANDQFKESIAVSVIAIAIAEGKYNDTN